MKNIVILLSGNGTNLQSIIDAVEKDQIAAKIQAVFSNNAAAYGLERARKADIPAYSIDNKKFPDREAFDYQLMQAIDRQQPDLIVLAGYMRILSPTFVAHYAGKILNIHPSLLPKYPGLHTHQRALENGDTEHGTSVHFVTGELDSGPVILQAIVPIFEDDKEEEIKARVQYQEHTIYPLVISWFVDGRLKLADGSAWLDGQRLPSQGYAA